MANQIIDRVSTRRRSSERRSMVVAGIIVVGCLVAALVGLIVAFGAIPASTIVPARATTVLVLIGFVLFLGAQRRRFRN